MAEDGERVIPERRRFERRGFLSVVRIGEDVSLEPKVAAKILNISQGGMYLEADEALDMGRKLFVSLLDPEGLISDVYFGEIRWQKELNDPYSARFGYGIEFIRHTPC
jgi:hypothetical protein